ncbi:PAIP1 protein, partial [Crypturellus soui]|nr:PAIP1 protein [Crypturellus soui]
MSGSFDRAPGAGRGRGQEESQGKGPGRGRGGGAAILSAPESGGGARLEGSAAHGPGLAEPPQQHKLGGFLQQQEPLRPPRTALPGAGNAEHLQQTRILTNSQDKSLVPDSGPAMAKPQVTVAPVVISKLSANAPEFYPSGYNPNFAESPFEDGCEGYLTLTEYVQDFLNHLTEQPGCFETEIEQFAETLNGWVTMDEALQELVELIYQQATSVPNFSYMGARLCNYLSHHLTINPQSGNFRQLLLQRCRTEYENRDQAAKGDEITRKQFHAFVLFLAELYLNLEIKGTKGQVTRAEVLQAGLGELLNALFSNPVDNNLICAVKLLKV